MSGACVPVGVTMTAASAPSSAASIEAAGASPSSAEIVLARASSAS